MKSKIAIVDLLLAYPPRGGAGVDLFNNFTKLLDKYEIKVFGISFKPPQEKAPQDFQRGIIQEEPPLDCCLIELETGDRRNEIISKILMHVSNFCPDLVFIGDGWTLKPYVARELSRYFKTIVRVYAYEMLCPRNNQKWLFNHKCDNNALKDCGKCLRCASEYAKIVRDQRNGRDNPLTFEAALADIWGGDYCDCLSEIVRECHFIVYNAATEQLLQRHNCLSVTKIPGAVDLDEFIPQVKNNKAQTAFNILVFGRMDDKAKGALTAIEAGLILRDKNINFKMVITSEKKYDYEWLVEVGWQSREQLIKLLKDADCVIVPSMWDEAFGMTWVEAAAMKVPVIASRTGGPAEYIKDGVMALLAEPGDAKDFAEKTLTLHNDAGLRERLSANARKEVETLFNWTATSEMTAKVIEKVISETADLKNQSKD